MPAALVRRSAAETSRMWVPGIMPRPGPVTVWISSQLLQTCIDEATRTFPLEAGGTFMGWWSDAATVVVTAMIGPGPDAVHGQHDFAPDQAWQLAQIADHYQASGRRETYLGDWHSHPKASSGMLSWTDRRVLRRIIHSSEARCAEPLMAVLWGAGEAWQTEISHARLRPRSLLWDRLVVEPAGLRVY